MNNKRATLKDIAEEAGVSTAVVSAVVNKKENQGIFVGEEKKEEIQDLIEKLQYTPYRHARALSKQKSGTIGVVMHRLTPYFSALVEKLQEAAFGKNLEVMPYITGDRPDKEEKLLKMLSDGRVDGVIITSATRGSKSRYVKYNRNPYNLKMVTTCHDVPEIPSVELDLEAAGRLAAAHLTECGCKNLVAFGGDSSGGRVGSFTEKARQNGALVEFLGVESYTFDDCFRDGKPIAHDIFEQGEVPDGIFGYNDLMGVMALREVQAAGYRVPEDVKIISCDNTEICHYTYPKLSSIENYISKKAGLLLKKILGIVEGHKLDEKHTRIDPELVLRGSTVQDAEADWRTDETEAVLQV